MTCSRKGFQRLNDTKKENKLLHESRGDTRAHGLSRVRNHCLCCVKTRKVLEVTSGVTRETAPDDTIQGVTPEWNYFLWLNLERTVDKRRRKVPVVTRRHLKGHHFAESDG